jgi:hypothetical protein
MNLGDGLGSLTYSTLVHPGDTWDKMNASVRKFCPEVKKAVSPDKTFAVSLRLSGQSAELLAGDAAERAELREFLAAEDMYVMTVNAFPYGPFKGGMVKEQVYEPDWTSETRVAYTTAVAEVLADIVPQGTSPSIQTAPLAFRPNVTGPDYVEAFTVNVLRVVANLVDIERRTGCRVKLAIEPEPYCFLATTVETVDYFNDHLFTGVAAATLAGLAGMALSEAHGALRRHLGVVFDICHQAVEFEDIPTSLALLAAAGIPVFKLQEAAALWIPDVNADTVAELERYSDTIYLTQTTQQRGDEITRFLNIEDAVKAWRDDPRPVPHDSLRHRAGLAGSRQSPGVGSVGDRDLHMGRAARAPQERRHHYLRHPRVGMGRTNAQDGPSERVTQAAKSAHTAHVSARVLVGGADKAHR